MRKRDPEEESWTTFVAVAVGIVVTVCGLDGATSTMRPSEKVLPGLAAVVGVCVLLYGLSRAVSSRRG